MSDLSGGWLWQRQNAGPVMPEVPSGAVLAATAELLRDHPAAPVVEIYATIRAALAKEQHGMVAR